MATPGSSVGSGALITPGGAQGPTGAQGATGSAGSAGAAATITAGTATGLPAGSNPTVSNSGTSSAAVFNFGIPAGATGNTGATGPAGPSTPSANTGNLLTTGTDSLLYLPPSAIQPTIWSARLRTFSSIGNPNAEVCQRNCSAALTNPASGTFIEDRWSISRGGTFTLNAFRVGSPVQQIVVPGTNFVISNAFFRYTLTGQQATLGATDLWQHGQTIEGIGLRELILDVHSVSLLVQSSVAGVTFGLSISDPTGTRSLCKLCTIPSANTWTLIQLSNLPVFPSAGTFNTTPGNAGYGLRICLGAGSTYTAPANDTWQNGNFIGALGQSNFAAQAVNSTFDIAFVQHEPGANCTTLIDCPFQTNLDSALRYFYKTYDYGTTVGTVTSNGVKAFIAPNANTQAFGPFQFPKPMAKSPTVTFYNHATGTVNSVQAGDGTNHASASASNPSQNGFMALNYATATGAAMQVFSHFSADTGW